MDILRKELNQLYFSQHLETEFLDYIELDRSKLHVSNMIAVTDACAVITDASNDSSFLYAGIIGRLLGLTDDETLCRKLDSSDEDIIYERLHPEDLVEKRMLEYEFFKLTDKLPAEEKRHYKATCTIRIKDKSGEYQWFDNSTQILKLSPKGKIWLILCRYDISSNQNPNPDINATIMNHHTGESHKLSLSEKRAHVLTDREKEILILIKDGKLSKEIADILEISVHTVNRHRQNILEKLSVGNSIEAITAAIAMRLI